MQRNIYVLGYTSKMWAVKDTPILYYRPGHRTCLISGSTCTRRCAIQSVPCHSHIWDTEHQSHHDGHHPWCQGRILWSFYMHSPYNSIASSLLVLQEKLPFITHGNIVVIFYNAWLHTNNPWQQFLSGHPICVKIYHDITVEQRGY